MRKVRHHQGVLLAALVLPNTKPSIEITGFNLVEAKSHIRLLELNAKQAKLYKPQNLIGLKEVQSTVWNEKRQSFEVRGQRAIMNSDTQDFEVQEQAQILTPDSLVFTAPQATYNAKLQTIESKGNVTANRLKETNGGPYLKIKGTGLNIDVAKGLYDLKKNVSAEQRISEKNRFYVVSNSARFDPSQQFTSFLGNVLLKSSNLEMKGERLDIQFDNGGSGALPQSFDLSGNPKKQNKKIHAVLPNMNVISDGLKIYFDQEGSVQKSEAQGEVNAETKDNVKINADKLTSDTLNGRSRVLMNGRVTMWVNEKVAKCEEAQYFPDTGDVILEKIASVVQKDQKLEGELIRFSTKSSEISVEKVKGQMDSKDMLGR